MCVCLRTYNISVFQRCWQGEGVRTYLLYLCYWSTRRHRCRWMDACVKDPHRCTVRPVLGLCVCLGRPGVSVSQPTKGGGAVTTTASSRQPVGFYTLCASTTSTRFYFLPFSSTAALKKDITPYFSRGFNANPTICSSSFQLSFLDRVYCYSERLWPSHLRSLSLPHTHQPL